MKSVMAALFILIGLNVTAQAQTTSASSKKATVVKTSKAKAAKEKASAVKHKKSETVVLVDEGAYPAKSRFHAMLEKRVKVDAAERRKQQDESADGQ